MITGYGRDSRRNSTTAAQSPSHSGNSRCCPLSPSEIGGIDRIPYGVAGPVPECAGRHRLVLVEDIYRDSFDENESASHLPQPHLPHTTRTNLGTLKPIPSPNRFHTLNNISSPCAAANPSADATTTNVAQPSSEC